MGARGFPVRLFSWVVFSFLLKMITATTCACQAPHRCLWPFYLIHSFIHPSIHLISSRAIPRLSALFRPSSEHEQKHTLLLSLSLIFHMIQVARSARLSSSSSSRSSRRAAVMVVGGGGDGSGFKTKAEATAATMNITPTNLNILRWIQAKPLFD